RLEQIAPQGDQQDHGDGHAHAREGNGAALLKCGSRLLSSTILVCWLSRMRSFGHRCLAAWYAAWASRKSSTAARTSTMSPSPSTNSTECLKWLRTILLEQRENISGLRKRKAPRGSGAS